MANFQVADDTGAQSVSGFDESLEKVFGMKAEEFAAVWDARESDAAADARVRQVLDGVLKIRWRMRLKSSLEKWKEEEKLRVSVVEAWPCDIVGMERGTCGDIGEVASKGPPVSGGC